MPDASLYKSDPRQYWREAAKELGEHLNRDGENQWRVVAIGHNLHVYPVDGSPVFKKVHSVNTVDGK